MKKILLSICLIPLFLSAQNSRQNIAFNLNWQFCNQEDITATAKTTPTGADFTFAGWETVNLPHTAKVEPLVVINPWVGVSWYKKDFSAKPEWKNKVVSVAFEAAMQQAEVWLNGKLLLKHIGGYLPFSVDISKELNYDKPNRLVVKTDNTDNAEIAPGKPIKELDFCYYSGIYRNVSLVITNPLHITDAVKANQPASGGVRVWFPTVSKNAATIAVATHIANENNTNKTFHLLYKLTDKAGKVVATATSAKLVLTAQSSQQFTQHIPVSKPQLWHPAHPNLYNLQLTIVENEKATDELTTSIGIRKIEVVNEKMLINGEPLLLVGTNRHQEYPYIGNALSDNAQYRDALKIKQAGFNIVRLSHYPQSPAFMAACDELGILTIAAIPGWQFVGNETFMQHAYQDARELIRRDRNHASVAMWELSLNESPMPDHFMQNMVKIASEESPESKLITCGWINKFYDVYIPARQHAKYPNYWKKYNDKTPLFTGEYGDWEYFAQDAGLNQAGYAGLKNDERTSRQLRADGEKRLLQQATNFQEAHNDNLNNPHLGDANWLMFDYNRGYSPDIESSGIMDIYRLPKFSYYFYQTQVRAEKTTVKIASYWNQLSDYTNLKVYSNCDEVALYLNNKLVERKAAGRNNISSQLRYPPFIFNIKKFEAGQLKAMGYIKNNAVAQDLVSTAGQAAKITLTYDQSGKALKAGGGDVVFVYATLCDKDGNTITHSDKPVHFTVQGDAKLIGQNPVKAEAGIATILLQAGTKAGIITLEAQSEQLPASVFKIKAEK